MTAPIPISRGPRAPEPLPPPRGFTRADLMTATEVAELLGVPISTVRE